MEEKYRKDWRLYSTICLLAIILASVPQLYNAKSMGIDPSWMYALNRFAAEGGYIFGKDVVFTYGPLGFLVWCMNEGNNMLIATIIWLALLTIHVYLLYQFLFKLKRGNDVVLVVLGTFLYLISVDTFSDEYYLCYLALFSLMLVLNGYKKDIFIFDIILILSIYIKFSLFIMILGLLAVYILFGYFYNKELYRYCLIRIIIGIMLSPLIYFAICGFSLTNFISYIKGSVEIASGYNVAMSVNYYDIYAIWIIAAAYAFLICIILAIKSGIYNLMTMLLVGFCLLMAYKHAFVRADDHINIAFNGIIFFLSIIFMFLQWDKIFESYRKSKIIYTILLSFMLAIAIVKNGRTPKDVVDQLRSRVLDLPLVLQNVSKQKAEGLEPLPTSIIMEIGNASVTIYPWEISYCVSSELNYVPLATVQAYSTYTPYLDKISAEKFLSSKAPEYIVLSKSTIDNRWPFIECPQTWEVIRNYYNVCLQEGDLFLLKRNTGVGNLDYHLVNSSNYLQNDIIELNGADYLKISTDLNFKGFLAKIFWKIDTVNMHVYYSDGREEVHRVLLDMLSEGVELGTLATTDETLINMLNGVELPNTVDKIVFEGDGLKYYKNNIDVEFYISSSNKEISPK